MKFLYCTDLHITDKKPEFRNDSDYLVTCLDKLTQIFELAKKNSCKTIICGGDMFDSLSGNPSPICENKVADIISSYEDIMFKLVVGNHDTVGGIEENVRVFSRVGMFEHLSNFCILSNCVFDSVGTVSYRRKPKRKDFIFPKQPRVIVSHNYWVPKCFGDPAPQAKDIDSIPRINTELVLLGHYHIPFEFCNKTTMYVNPGSVMRKACTEENRNRIPQVLIVNVGKKVSYKYIQLKADKCPFLLAEKKEKDTWNSKVQDWIEELNQTRLHIGITLEERLKNLLSNYNSGEEDDMELNERAIKELLRRLKRVT